MRRRLLLRISVVGLVMPLAAAIGVTRTRPSGPDEELQGHRGAVHSVAFSPDGKTLATAGDDRTVRLWDMTKRGEPMVLKGHTERALSVMFAPDGKTLASGGADGTVRLWEAHTGKELAALQVPHAPKDIPSVSSLAFTADGRKLAAAVGLHNGWFKRRCQAVLWDVATRRELRTIGGDFTPAPSVAITPDGRSLALGSGPTVTLFELATGKPSASLQADRLAAVTCVAIAPDGKTLASGDIRGDRVGRDLPGQVVLWELATGKELATLRGHSSSITSLAFSPDGKRLASGRWDGTVKLWDVATAKEMATLEKDTGPVYSVAIAPDGKTLAAGGKSGKVQVWNIDQVLAQKQGKSP